jgi:hypothetical protein
MVGRILLSLIALAVVGFLTLVLIGHVLEHDYDTETIALGFSGPLSCIASWFLGR